MTYFIRNIFNYTCLVIPFSLKPLPNFSDPQLGFQTRGTSLSDRITTWYNLVEATKERGLFTANPRQYLQRNNISSLYKLKKLRNSRRKNRKKYNNFAPTILVEPSNVSDPNEKNWKDLRRLLNSSSTERKLFKPFNIPREGFFCGPPNRDYAHVVLRSKTGSDLFNLESLLVLCRIEQELIQTEHYDDLCVRKTSEPKCCKPWSLANYIALLQNRASCLAITEEDVNATKTLLQTCSHYFHNLELTADCDEHNFCKIPSNCIAHNAVYNILNYLASITFLPPNKTSDVILKETIIFIPLACSTAILPFYHELEKYNLDYGGISVVAMELGVKSALFDEYLIRDTWLMSFGGIFVLVCMWLYTGSLFLTVMTIIAIVFSLGISYFMYTLVLELHFFPFMNLLTTVVAVGIGADDAFVFCKVWQTMKSKKNISLIQIMNDTMRHAFVSMIVTSFTTSAAFLASYVSSITAIKCFSIFAGISVLANCIFMVLWFPACVVVRERYPLSHVNVLRGCVLACIQRWCGGTQWPVSLTCYMKFRWFWFTFLTLLAVVSAFIVLYYPGLQLPNSTEFQLFDTSHPFEQYDLKYKHRFWFTKAERIELESGMNLKLPLRFVWGVVPQDNGDHLEPGSLGTLKLDESFDISAPESQSILLPNCFIESFMDWMDKRCRDDFIDIDRTPCCETSIFPYKSEVFNTCIREAIGDLYDTSYFVPGVAGPKFSKDHVPVIKALVVEYDSNYSFSLSYDYMHNFIDEVETWFQDQLKTAPETMRGGWFVSSFEFYDLQRILSQGTLMAIGVSMLLALIVLFFATLNVITSLYAIFNTTCCIFVTMAILVLLGWKLNILESVAISTAIGLTVDFSLHFTVNYRLAPPDSLHDRKEATRYSLLSMLKPVTMAALTTGVAGAFMMPSTILAYIQIGTFLMTVMAVSWLYATFHLISLLAIGGPTGDFGQCTYSQILCQALLSKKQSNKSSRQIPDASSLSDIHELDLLTNSKSFSNSSAPNLLHRTLSGPGSSRCGVADQSPSTISAITIITTEDN
ncbi:putative hedgehog receptor [Trypoxylus dichotomus]